MSLPVLTNPVVKGAAPLSKVQFARLMEKSLNRVVPRLDREMMLAVNPNGAEQLGYGLAWVENDARDANLFNQQLADYRAAVARLDQYRLADGRPEISQEVETDKINEDGTPYIQIEVVQAAIDPLPATVDTINEDGQTVVRPNPLIIADDAERAAAQAVIDATPQEVKDWP
jgi:hypothetical protein